MTVALLNEDGTPVLDSEGKPMTAVTDEKGAYQFVGLAPCLVLRGDRGSGQG